MLETLLPATTTSPQCLKMLGFVAFSCVCLSFCCRQWRKILQNTSREVDWNWCQVAGWSRQLTNVYGRHFDDSSSNQFGRDEFDGNACWLRLATSVSLFGPATFAPTSFRKLCLDLYLPFGISASSYQYFYFVFSINARKMFCVVYPVAKITKSHFCNLCLCSV